MRSCARLATPISISSSGSKRRFYAFICNKKQRRPRRGSNYRRANAIVYAAKPSRRGEAGGGLEAGFEGVEGKEGEVYCCACYAACLDDLVCGNGRVGKGGGTHDERAQVG